MNKIVKSKATWQQGMQVITQSRNHSVVIDQPEAMGGKDSGANPMEVFLMSYGGCLGTVAAIVAQQKQIALNGFEVDVEGDFDIGYIMGNTTEGRAGFTEIRVNVKIDAEMSDDEKNTFFEEVESRCPITDTILNKTPIIVDIQ